MIARNAHGLWEGRDIGWVWSPVLEAPCPHCQVWVGPHMHLCLRSDRGEPGPVVVKMDEEEVATVKHESAFYDGLVRGANADGWWLLRTESSPGLLIPFDVMGTSPDGLAVGLECKRVDGLSLDAPTPWCLFSQAQRAWLARYADCGALALVALCLPGDEVVIIRYPGLAAMKWELGQLPHHRLTRVIARAGTPAHWVGWSQVPQRKLVPREMEQELLRHLKQK